MTPTVLFVYGTLRRGCDNDHARLLASNAEFLGKASIPGTLYRYDWHPGARAPVKPSDLIHGELYRLNDAATTFAVLDDYEGPEFDRVTVNAQLATGETIETWVYLYHGPKSGTVIPSGEWTSGLSQ